MRYVKPAHKRLTRKRIILVAIVILASAMGIFAAWDWEENTLDWRGILGNMSTELMGGVIAYFVIDQLITKNETSERLKQRLIRKLENPDGGFVKDAVQELSDNGWMSDGSLYGWFLQRANFTGINLTKADLRGVGLYRCILTDAKIRDDQLMALNDLRFCTLPNGVLYDGRYCLKGDIDWALSKYELDFNKMTLDEMADYYGVSVADFVAGQRWAKENLKRFSREVPHYLANLDLGDAV